jgi:hypothetical protein
MAKTRPTTRELAEARKKERMADMDEAIRDGRLTVRQMTPGERKQANADRDVVVQARAARKRRSR